MTEQGLKKVVGEQVFINFNIMRTRKHTVKFSGSTFKTFDRSCNFFFLFVLFSWLFCVPAFLPSYHVACNWIAQWNSLPKGVLEVKIRTGSKMHQALLCYISEELLSVMVMMQLQEVFTQLTAGCWHGISWEGMLSLLYWFFLLI